MKRIVSIVLALSIVFSFACSNTFAESNTSNSVVTTNPEEKIYCSATIEDNFEEGKVLVTLTLDATVINKVYTAAELTEKFGVSITYVEDLTSLDNPSALERINEETYHQILLLEIPQMGKQAVLDAIAIIEQHEDVLCASPNYIITLDPIDVADEPISSLETEEIDFSNELNEEAFETMALDAVYSNDTHRAQQFAIEQMDLPQAWAITTGSTQVLVGVADSGIDSSHPDLIDNLELSLGVNYTDDGLSAWADQTGHGTHVAGTIGAKGNNALGVTGVCWNVKMVSLKVFKKPLIQMEQ